MDQITKIKNDISDNPKIKRYQELEIIVKNNEVLNKTLKKLKEIQKEIVHAREFNLTKKLEELEKSYSNLYNTLFDYPLLNEYLDLQNEINLFLNSFSNIIETAINDELMAK